MNRLLDEVENEISYLAEHGLRVQGEHHKQWFLGLILLNINHKQYDLLLENGQDMGIAP